MIRYTSSDQLPIEEFALPFGGKLVSDNRWVILSQLLPWDHMASIYYRKMSIKKGAPGKNARLVIGAIIIKHMEKFSDEKTIQTIQENPFMQYFLGLSGFTNKPVFDPSLFVYIRKRLGTEAFDEMTQKIIEISIKEEKRINRKGKPDKKGNNPPSDDSNKGENKQDATKQAQPNNKGKLKLDATVADSFIKFPTDLDLLNDSREKSEELIDFLFEDLKLTVKPRTYRQKARKDFLSLAKKKNKNHKEIRKSIRKQLGYLNRNIKFLYKMLDQYQDNSIPFDRQQYKYFFVIQEVYRQQLEMYKKKEHSCQNRIVSIHQPHVRPIVRGKAKAKVEFGAKIGVSLRDGFSRIDTLSWEAYNENTDLQRQCENYNTLYGYYPELVLVDRIYLTLDNRNWLKARNIRIIGKPLGRPPKEELTAYQKRKRRKEEAERNHIEGKFGQGKNGYELNKIRARLQDTSESWIAAIFLVMNLVRLSKDFLFAHFSDYLRRLFMLLEQFHSFYKDNSSYGLVPVGSYITGGSGLVYNQSIGAIKSVD
jgi:transposase, IS5 family